MNPTFDGLASLLGARAFELGSLGAREARDVAGDVLRTIPVVDRRTRMAADLPSSLVARIADASRDSAAWVRHEHEGVWAAALGAVSRSRAAYGVSWAVGPGDLPILAALGCEALPPIADPFDELPMTFRCGSSLLLSTKCGVPETAWLQAWRGLWSWGSVFFVLAEGREEEFRELAARATVDDEAVGVLCRAVAAVFVPRFDLDGAWILTLDGEAPLSVAASLESHRRAMCQRLAAGGGVTS